MALNIKDPETDRLALELEAATGESITVAARRALEERLERVRHSQRASESAHRDVIDGSIARGRARTGYRPEHGHRHISPGGHRLR